LRKSNSCSYLGGGKKYIWFWQMKRGKNGKEKQKEYQLNRTEKKSRQAKGLLDTEIGEEEALNKKGEKRRWTTCEGREKDSREVRCGGGGESKQFLWIREWSVPSKKGHFKKLQWVPR